ncbi:D-ribose ABC transporter permease [Gammaproteobacteria bacterium]|nr:D-ribose ABC transporter permease [Gammaproteobacteria bacterium]
MTQQIKTVKTVAINKTQLKSILMKLAPLMSLILLIIYFSLASPHFFSVANLMSVALQTSVIGIMAIGVTYVIITAGIDLSLGSIMAFSGVIVGMVASYNMPISLAIMAGVFAGTFCGFINGFLVAKAKIPAFIATLGIMMSVRGINMVLTDGRSLYFIKYPEFKSLAQGYLFNTIPLPVIYFFVIAIIAAFILKRTVVGRYIYALGSNEAAAKLSGIKVDRIKLFAFSFSGLMAGISGVILASRINSGNPSGGQGYELEAIAAVIIGGTSLNGGIGTIGGTIIGAFIMSILKNGLNLMGVSQFWQMVAMGGVVIGAVYLDTLRNKSK